MVKRFFLFTALLIACLSLFLYGYEHYTRSTTTYVPPVRFRVDAPTGIRFDPDSASTLINSLGFDDHARDPAATGKRRILLVGDSFVSGSVLIGMLENALNEGVKDRPFEMIPMAFPGIGLGTMFAYVEQLGLQFHPEFVPVVFNSSTFENDSAILNAIRERQHPLHASQPIFAWRDGQCSRISADPDASQYALKELPSYHPKTFYVVLEEFLEKHLSGLSLFNWLKDSVALDDAKGFLARDAQYAYRYQQLRSDPYYNALLADWNFPDDLDMNTMFWTPTDQMPGVFRNALDCTRCALQAFNELAKQNGFRFLLVITDDCSFLHNARKEEFDYRDQKAKRPFVDQEYKNKIIALAKQTHTDYIDLYQAFGANSPRMHAYDIHWNKTGIQNAAAAIAKDLLPRLQAAQ